jgi:hypothetical protein
LSGKKTNVSKTISVLVLRTSWCPFCHLVHIIRIIYICIASVFFHYQLQLAVTIIIFFFLAQTAIYEKCSHKFTIPYLTPWFYHVVIKVCTGHGGKAPYTLAELFPRERLLNIHGQEVFWSPQPCWTFVILIMVITIITG